MEIVHYAVVRKMNGEYCPAILIRIYMLVIFALTNFMGQGQGIIVFNKYSARGEHRYRFS